MRATGDKSVPGNRGRRHREAQLCPSCYSAEIVTASAPADQGEGDLPSPFLLFYIFLPRYIPTNEPSLALGTSARKSSPSLRPSLAFGAPREGGRIKGAHALIARGDKGAST